MAKNTVIRVDNYNVSLSKAEVALLSNLERERVGFITTEEVKRRAGATKAIDLVRSMVRKGALKRIQRGVYLVRPFRALTRPSTSSSAIAAAALLEGQPYYLGGLWALNQHGLSSQTFGNVLDVFVGKRRSALRPFVFHVIAGSRFHEGLTDTVIEGVRTLMSDLERTLLDALDVPRAFGGIEAALEYFATGLERADRKKLVRYALASTHPTTWQRLGVLLERAKTPARDLAALRRKMRQTASLTSMIPSAPRRGPVNATWNVVENDR